MFAVLSFTVAMSGITPASALNASDYPGQDILYYSKDATCVAATDSASGSLVGSGNLEKIYNYMISKGLKDYQAAGVVGNISQESGGNPLNAQVGPDTKDPTQFGTKVGVGKAWGIIQWDAGGRAVTYAKQANITGPIYELSTQLDLVWWHMTTETPTSAKNFIEKYKKTTDVIDATNVYEKGMEGAGKPNMTDRESAAKAALKKYGSGTDGTADADVAQADATAYTTVDPCGSGSVDGGSIVEIAQTELAKKVREWDKNALKYTDGNKWAWCASFVSWVYDQAGQTITGGMSGGWLHPSVLEMRSWFKKNAIYFKVGTQTPQPGDVAFYVQAEAKPGQVLGGAHHVNIVETVSDDGKTMTAIGGNQSNQVTRWKVNIQQGQYALVGFGRMK